MLEWMDINKNDGSTFKSNNQETVIVLKLFSFFIFFDDFLFL